MGLAWQEVLLRLVLASLFGALIGLERERKDWAAGLRTHMMVAVGSCLIMLVSAYGFADVIAIDGIDLDPSRVAAQVVSGIGFIGAGAILFSRQGRVRGLTTAAGLWTVAAIGLATGGGMYFAAAITTLIALIILWLLNPLESIYSSKFKRSRLIITTKPEENYAALIQSLQDKIQIQSLSLEKEEDKFVFQIKIDRKTSVNIDSIIQELKDDAAVFEIYWKR